MTDLEFPTEVNNNIEVRRTRPENKTYDRTRRKKELRQAIDEYFRKEDGIEHLLDFCKGIYICRVAQADCLCGKLCYEGYGRRTK